jgi:hypothetical protein
VVISADAGFDAFAILEVVLRNHAVLVRSIKVQI